MSMRHRTIVASGLVIAVLALRSPAGAQPARTASDFGAQGTAKVICSALFVSGRDLDEALRNSAPTYAPREDLEALRSGSSVPGRPRIEVDRGAMEVAITVDGFTGRARHHGDQGCVIIPPGADEVFFEPLTLRTTLPDANSQPWPMGDASSGKPWPLGVDRAAVERATELAFPDGGLTASFVVLYRGEIIAERYGEGADKDTQLESWSMGKSLTATLFGLLVKDGHFDLDEPAPVPLWHEDPEDPRGNVLSKT